MELTGKVYSINASKTKGTAKKPVKEAMLVEEYGVQGDAHAGSGVQQVSMLSIESIRRQKACPKVKKKKITLQPGDFAENITTAGIDLAGLKTGSRLKIGQEVILEISRRGKDCHKYCAIYYKLGDCIMPREGIFAKVIRGGLIRVNDGIRVMDD